MNEFYLLLFLFISHCVAVTLYWPTMHLWVQLKLDYEKATWSTSSVSAVPDGGTSGHLQVKLKKRNLICVELSFSWISHPREMEEGGEKKSIIYVCISIIHSAQLATVHLKKVGHRQHI